MSAYQTKPLSAETWPAFADLVERHDGVWGGCWCIEFHPDGKARGPHRRSLKERKVQEGTTHAALVFDGERCIGWCQYGTPEELPRIRNLGVYNTGLVTPPDWRITCFFVDREYRGKGVATAALTAAVAQIAQLGGGTVESYPEDVEDRKVPASFLHNSRLAMFEHQGFRRERRIGKHRWVVSRTVPPAASGQGPGQDSLVSS